MRFTGTTFDHCDSPEARQELNFLRKKVGQLQKILATTGNRFGALRGHRADGSTWSVHVIPGTSGGPLVVLRAQRASPEIDKPVVEIYDLETMLFEHGALRVFKDSRWDAEDAEPCTVHIGDDLRDYFSGSGTPLGAGAHSYFQWLISDSLSQVTPRSEIQPLGSAESYPSRRFTRKNYLSEKPVAEFMRSVAERDSFLSSHTPPVTLSSIYTGFLRYGVQSWIGSGREVGSASYIYVNGDAGLFSATDPVCPFETVEPHNDGLIYDEDYNFWWVRVEPTQVKFRRLKATRKGTALAKLKTATPDEDPWRKYMMVVLSGLRPDEDTEEVVCPLADLSLAVGDGRAPVAYGWHFNRQAPWKASIVTQREIDDATWYREATLATLSFSFSDGAPTCSISISEQDTRFSLPSINPLWFYDHNAWCCLASKTSSYFTADVPLYCFYDDTGALRVLRHTRYPGELEESDVGDLSRTTCGFDTQHVEREVKTFTRSGGYLLGAADFRECESSSGIRYVYDYAIVENGSSTNPSILFSVPSSCCSEVPDFGNDWYIPVGNLTSYYGTIADSLYTYTFSISGEHNFAQIPVNDAEAVYLVKPTQSVTSGVHDWYTQNGNPGGYSGIEGFVSTVMTRESSQDPYVPMVVDWNWCAINHGGFLPGDTVDEHTEAVPETTEWTGEAFLITSRGEFPLTYTDWDSVDTTIMSYIDPCPPFKTGCSATFSYRTGWNANPPDGPYIENGGFEFGEEDLDPIRWMGDV